MAFGLNLAQNGESSRVRTLMARPAPDNHDDGVLPAPPTEVASVPSQPQSSPSLPPRTGGGFRPGGSYSRTPAQQVAVESKAPSPSLPIEDGISSVMVIRRLLEVSVVERWSQSKVEQIEREAHVDPASAWQKVASYWEVLSERRRATMSSRNSDFVSFRIANPDGTFKDSGKLTGPMATSMALLQGLELTRLPLSRAPFSEDVLRSMYISGRRPSQPHVEPKPETGASSTENNTPTPVSSVSSPLSAPSDQGAPVGSVVGRFVRQSRL